MPRKKKKTWRKVLLIGFVTFALLLALGVSLAAIYKKEIIALVNDQLEAALHTEASIGDADITFVSDFPNITLLLKDVAIGKDSLSGREVLKARRIHLNLRTFKLLYRQIEFRSVRLQDAHVYIFKTSSGFSNLDIFKGKDDTVRSEGSAKLTFEHQHLILQNVKVAFYDSLKKKYYDLTFQKVDGRLVNHDSLMAISARGPVLFEGLTFNPDRGAFLNGVVLTLDLSMQYRRDSSILDILPSHADAPAGKAAISGRIKFSEPKDMRLKFSTEKVEYEKGIAILADSIRVKLAKLNITGPMAVEVDLHSNLIPGIKPAVDIQFSFPKNRLTSDKIDVTELSLKGQFTNHVNNNLPYDNANTVIHLTEIKGEMDHLPFYAEATLFNPSDMTMELHSVHSFDLVKLNEQADTAVLKFSGGSFNSEFRYAGKLREYLDPTVTKYTGKLDGKMEIKDGSFTVVGRRLKFTNLNTLAHFTQDAVTLDQLSVKTGKSSVAVTGTFVNYVPYFIQPQEKGYIKLDIKSPNLDVGSLLTSKKKKMSAKAAAKQKKKVSDMLDMVVKNLQFEVRFAIAQYKNKSFQASKVEGDFRLKGNSLDAKNVKMDFGRGTLAISASMRDLQKNVNPVELTAKMSNVHIKDLFTAFNNFGQKTITDDNLYGSINMDTKFKTNINDEFDVILPTLKGHVALVVMNGRLVNFAPLQKMSNFLFKKRDFDDVHFAQINCNFDVVNRDLTIERMEVESTILTLFLEGKYSLGDGNTDLSIQVPLSNLKKRDKTYVPERVGEDTKVGPSVFLRAQSNEKGETEITYDPFKKWRKKKGK